MLESQVSLLIGADSGQTEEPSGVRSLYLHKLQRHPKAILAWGAAGNPSNWYYWFQHMASEL
jgi:hypothetical protein